MPVPIPSSLVRHLKEGRCALFVGAGLSASAGLPDWKSLLIAMVTDIENEGVSDGAGLELRKLIEAGKLLDVADHCRQRLGERRYQELLGEQLRGGSGDIPDAHRIITQLPFSAVVTTNYDKLLERAYTRFRGDLPKVVTSRDRESLGSLLFSGGFFILKAHGDIDDAASLVLTARDYREIIHANPAFDALFSALLMTRSILFLGYSLGDPDFRLLMDRQLSAFGENIPERYAVMAGVGTVESDVIKRGANIKVLPYPAEKHEEVPAFLQALMDRLAPAGGMLEVSALPVQLGAAPSRATTAPSQTLERSADGVLGGAVPAAAKPSMRDKKIEDARVLAPLALPGIELRLVARDDRLECRLKTEQGQSLHVSERLSWSRFFQRLVTLLENRQPDRRVDDYRRVGARLADMLPKEAIRALPHDQPLTLVIDRELAEVPWELARCDDDALAVERPVVRTLAAEGTMARGLPGVRQPARVLVVGDPGVRPSFRLPGAFDEAVDVGALYEEAGIQCTVLCRESAGLDAVVDALMSEAFDVVHFAGHAWFDPHESYLAFDENEELTASELRTLLGPRPPALLILNSHYTAFLPRGLKPAELSKSARDTDLPPTSHIGFTSVAAATGVGAFLGCFGSPMDEAAKRFGVQVHRELLAGRTIVDAVRGARRATLKADATDVSALQYILAGHPGYRLVGEP